MAHRYALALGSNRYAQGHPKKTISRALDLLCSGDCTLEAASRIACTRPLGPGQRNFANAAALIETDREPRALLALTKKVERRFGRRRGRRWGDRVLDIDIILWSGGIWARDDLVVPHPAFRSRAFVLDPLSEIAPGWRDPVSGLTIAQLDRRLHRNSPVDRTG